MLPERLAACATCREILEKIENVDDEVARHGGQMPFMNPHDSLLCISKSTALRCFVSVTFYRTPDIEFAGTQGVHDFPALIYFSNGVPSVFEGDLTSEEDVLHWVIDHRTESRIELVTRGMLEQEILETHYLAVFFCTA